MKIEKISNIVLTVLIIVSIVAFLAFAVVGYDTPWEENPKYVNPKLTDLILVWTYVLIGATIVLTVVSVIMQLMSSSTSNEKGLAGKTNIIAFGIFIISIAVGIGIGSSNMSEHLLINGKDWCEPTAIIITDTSIISIAVLMVVTVIVTAISMFLGVKK